MRMTRLATALVAVAFTAGCGVHVGVEDDNEKPAAKATATPSSTAEATPTAEADMIEVPVAPQAPDQPCTNDTDQVIPAVDIPEVRTEPIRVPDYVIGGTKVPGFVIPGVHIPAQRVPEQCATHAPAPAGCFGKVTIPAVTIPAVTIPEARIPAVNVPGASPQSEVIQAAVTGAAVHEPEVTTPQACAQKVQPGEYRPSVYQSSTYRSSVYRSTVYRSSVYRSSVCVDGDCIPPIRIEPISIGPVRVDPVRVDPSRLDGRYMPEIKSKCVSVLQGGGSTAYNVCSDVLFDFDKADIRSDAAAVLRQVARSLNKRFTGRSIQVDGHTDSQGSDGYNDRLSLRRAEAVKRWLVANGGIAASRITTKGYGESEPVDTNATDAGRQRNRRVVVGVTKG